MTFSEKYGNSIENPDCYKNAVEDIGLTKIRRLLPWNDDHLLAAYTVDKHFNTKSTPLDTWDKIAGYSENHKTGDLSAFPSPLKDIFYDKKVDTFSCSQLVCVLKEAAKMYVETVL